MSATLVCLVMSGIALGEPKASEKASEWGNIKGRIVWNAEKLPPEKMLAADRLGIQVPSEEWVVNPKNRGIRSVVVWLTAKDQALPIHPDLRKPQKAEAYLDIVNHSFHPHVLALREGQDLVVNNLMLGNCDVALAGSARNPSSHRLLPAQTLATVKGLKADRWPLLATSSCHAWMKSYIRVFDHPYFAVTDADGGFEIKPAPAGEWQLMIWHETGWIGGAKGKDGRKVTIALKGGTDLGNIHWELPEMK